MFIPHGEINSKTEQKQLWSGSAGVGDTIELSEPFTNFYELVFQIAQGLYFTFPVIMGTPYIKTGISSTSEDGSVAILGFIQFREIVGNKTLPIQSFMCFTITSAGVIAPLAGLKILRVYGIRRR